MRTHAYYVIIAMIKKIDYGGNRNTMRYRGEYGLFLVLSHCQLCDARRIAEKCSTDFVTMPLSILISIEIIQ